MKSKSRFEMGWFTFILLVMVTFVVLGITRYNMSLTKIVEAILLMAWMCYVGAGIFSVLPLKRKLTLEFLLVTIFFTVITIVLSIVKVMVK